MLNIDSCGWLKMVGWCNLCDLFSRSSQFRSFISDDKLPTARIKEDRQSPQDNEQQACKKDREGDSPG